MSIEIVTVFLFGSMILFLVLGLPVAFALGGLAAVFTVFLWSPDALSVIAINAWKGMSSFTMIAIPLFIQTMFIFALGYFILARYLRLSYHDAAPSAMIGASNHFEVAIATATILFGLSSGAALATVVGVLIEVPVMLFLVIICKRTCYMFRECNLDYPWCKKEDHFPVEESP